MERVATRRLIDAAASLGAADRALLNLWVNRGLDDAAVARMTGMEPGAIAERRGRIVTALSEELGLPPGDVADAVAAIAASDGPDLEAGPVPAPATSDNGRPDQSQTETDASLNGHAPAVDGVLPAAQTPDAAAEAPEPQIGVAADTTETEAAPQTVVAADTTETEAAPQTGVAADIIEMEAASQTGVAADIIETEAASQTGVAADAIETEAGTERETPRSRRRLWAWVSLLLVAVVALVVVLVASGSDTKPRRSAVARAHTTPAVTTPPTTPAPPPAASRAQPDTLGALPGGAAHARGSLVLSGKPNHLKLRLTVTGLPPAHRGHYEVWLYNTIIAAQPVARLRNGVRHLVIALPRRPARFHWVDISFQPVGTVYHSGESLLRAPNPARASARQLRSRSRRTRQLRRATSGSSSASTSK